MTTQNTSLKHLFSTAAGVAAFLVLAQPMESTANERHFTFTHETATLPLGAKEIELWTTARLGRDQYYSRLDHKAEFEFGIAKHVMGAFYLNWNKTTQYQAGDLISSFNWDGIATEVKVQLTDPSANAVGSALYLEAAYGTDEMALEAKGLFDKHLGDWILAANLVGEGAWENHVSLASADDVDVEWTLGEIEAAVHLAAAYDWGHGFTTGLEAIAQAEYELEGDEDEYELESMTFHVGPTLSYSSKGWWTTLTVLPQLPAGKSEGTSVLDLHGHERIRLRWLLSFHI